MSQENSLNNQKSVEESTATTKPVTVLSPGEQEALDAKYDVSKGPRYIDLISDATNVTGIRIKNFSDPSSPLVLSVGSFESQGLLDDTYAQNNNSIIFRKGGEIFYMADTSNGDVAKKLTTSGFKKVEGVGVPSLGNPDLLFAGNDDSTLASVKNNFSKYGV